MKKYIVVVLKDDEQYFTVDCGTSKVFAGQVANTLRTLEGLVAEIRLKAIK